VRVKDAFDRLIKQLPPQGVYLERPSSTKLRIFLELPSAGEVQAINARVDAAHEKMLQLYQTQQQTHRQAAAKRYREAQQARDRRIQQNILVLLAVFLLSVALFFWMQELIGTLIVVCFVLFMLWKEGVFTLPERLDEKKYNYPLPSKERYYQPPLTYTHLGLELSPRGGVIHEYKHQKKVGFILEFKWYEIKQVIQRLAVAPYVLLRVNKNSGYPIFSELHSAVKIEYCSQLLHALVQQRHLGNVPEDWYQPAGLEAFEPELKIELPEEKIKIDREEHHPASLVDLSKHLVDEDWS
jgi:hypothetical protein